VRRETGKELMVQVHHDEGIANRIDPDSASAARGGGRWKCESAKHGPGTVPGNRVTGAEAHTEFRENITTRRCTPEVGAVCPNWARTDLCGAREVTRIPAAKVIVASTKRREGPQLGLSFLIWFA
jgi:hypothetical protein